MLSKRRRVGLEMVLAVLCQEGIYQESSVPRNRRHQLGKLCAYLQPAAVSAHVCGGRLALGGLPARAVRARSGSHNRGHGPTYGEHRAACNRDVGPLCEHAKCAALGCMHSARQQHDGIGSAPAGTGVCFSLMRQQVSFNPERIQKGCTAT